MLTHSAVFEYKTVEHGLGFQRLVEIPRGEEYGRGRELQVSPYGRHIGGGESSIGAEGGSVGRLKRIVAHGSAGGRQGSAGL